MYQGKKTICRNQILKMVRVDEIGNMDQLGLKYIHHFYYNRGNYSKENYNKGNDTVEQWDFN